MKIAIIIFLIIAAMLCAFTLVTVIFGLIHEVTKRKDEEPAAENTEKEAQAQKQAQN